MSNVFSFSGTVGRDAEVKYTSTGLAVMTVTVANHVGYGDKKKTLWVRVSLFGKRAEGSLSEYLKKGQQVFVSGELSLNEYKNKEGLTVASLELAANIIDLVGTSGKHDVKPAEPKQQVTSGSDNFDFDDLDIPF